MQKMKTAVFNVFYKHLNGFFLILLPLLLLLTACQDGSQRHINTIVSGVNVQNWNDFSRKQFTKLLSHQKLSQEQDLKRIKHLGLILLTHNEPQKAKEIFIALNKLGGSNDSNYYLADIAKELNDYDNALNYILQGLKQASKKDKFLFYLLRTEVLLEQGELQKAQTTNSTTLKLAQSNLHAHYLKAKINLLLGNCQLAIEEYQSLIERLPSFKQLYSPLASAYRLCGQMQLANKYAKIHSEEVIKFQNRFTQEKQQLGNPVRFMKGQVKLLNARKDYQAALKLLKEIVLLEPNDADSFLNLGSMHYALQEYELAKEAFIKANKLSPKSIKPLINLGVIALKENKLTQAQKYYQRAKSLDATHPKILLNLASVEFQLRHYKEAVKLYRALLEIQPNNKGVRVSLVVTLLQQGLFIKAYDFTNIWIEEMPSDKFPQKLILKILLKKFTFSDKQVQKNLNKLESQQNNSQQLTELLLLVKAKYHKLSINKTLKEYSSFTELSDKERQTFHDKLLELKEKNHLDLNLFQ
jgi:tetratricopeptide (TPR) repeat protein